MENTRRSFLKKVSAAGIGAAGLAMAGNAGATTTAAEPQKKKTAGKDDGKLRFGFIGTGSRLRMLLRHPAGALNEFQMVKLCPLYDIGFPHEIKRANQFHSGKVCAMQFGHRKIFF